MAAVLAGLLLTSRVPGKPAEEDPGADGVAAVGVASRGRVATMLRPRTVALPRAEIGLALFSAFTYAIGNVIRGDAVSAQMCVIASTRHIQVAIAIIISSALPVVVVPASLLLFGNTEQVNAQTVMGIVLSLVGVSILLLS